MMQTQGGQANLTGNRLEKFIEYNLLECGFHKVKDKKRLRRATNIVEPSYARQVHIGTTIYGTPLKCDFLIVHPDKWRHGLVIEAKWQQVGGTVDEKFPYFVLNVYESEFETILVIDGGGYRAGALAWLRHMQRDNFLHIFHMARLSGLGERGQFVGARQRLALFCALCVSVVNLDLLRLPWG